MWLNPDHLKPLVFHGSTLEHNAIVTAKKLVDKLCYTALKALATAVGRLC